MRSFLALLAVLCAASGQSPQRSNSPAALTTGRIIQTYVGTDWTFSGDGKAATGAPLGQTFGVVADSSGNVYAADYDNNIVVKFTPGGTLSVVAGNGFAGTSGDGGDARSASLNQPQSVALGPDGSLYVGDATRIRRVTPDGIIRTFAGGGFSTAEGISATAASLQSPLGIIFDSNGNLIFSDSLHQRVRKVTPGGIISTIAGNGQAGFSGDGGPALSAMLKNPYGLRFDASGNLLIADSENRRIRKVDSQGIITTFAGGGNGSGDGLATQIELVVPSPIDFDSAGNLYVLETVAGRVRKITPGGVATTIAGPSNGFAGDGGPAALASFVFPRGLALDRSGNILIGDTGNRRVRRITNDLNINTVAGNFLYRFSSDGTQATLAFLKRPARVAVNPVNQLLYYVDRDDYRVRRVEANGRITTVAGNGNATAYMGNLPVPATSVAVVDLFGLAFDSKGNLYLEDGQRIRKITPDGTMTNFAGGGTLDPGDGSPASAAALNQPRDLTFDASDNLYFSEMQAHRVRKVTPAGIISTVAGNGKQGFSGDGGPAAQAQLSSPNGVAVDSSGNLYIADSDNGRIRKVTPGGMISTYAGGGANPSDGIPAAQGSLAYPIGLALDAAGNLYIGDTFHQKVRVVTSDGSITTLAGVGGVGFSGDGGPAQLAKFGFSAAPATAGVAVDSLGNVYVADAENFRVRVIPAGAPSFTVTPGSLSFTVNAGDGPGAPDQLTVASSSVGLPFTISVNGSFLSVASSSPVTPSTVDVTVNPGALTPGNYSGSITLTPSVSGVAPVTVNVSVTVQAANPSVLAVDTSSLAFSLARGGSPATKVVQVMNSGSGSINFLAGVTTNAGGAWLSVSPVSGTTTPSAPVALRVTADPKGLEAGTYSGTVILSNSSNSKVAAISIPVSLTVSASGQLIRLSQSGLSFAAVAGAGVSPPQSVVVLNAGQGAFQFNAAVKFTSPPGNWLTVSPANGTSDISKPFPSFSVSVNATGLGAGDYFGRIDVTSPTADNSPQYLTVALHVFPAGTNPGPIVQPTGLVFTGVAGGGDPSSQTVQVTNISATPASFGSGLATLDGGQYVAYQPSFASLPTGSLQLVVQPALAGLGAGIYRGAITLVFSDGSIRTVAILIVLAPPGTVLGTGNGPATETAFASGCTPTKLIPLLTSLGTNFSVPASFPTSLQARVVDDCASPATSSSVVTSFSNGDVPLSLIALGNGNFSATWVSRNTSAREVTITGTADVPQPQLHGSVQVTGGLSGSSTVPVIGSGAIISASSFALGTPLAPGSMVSIFGSHLGNGTAIAPSLPLGTQLAGATLVVAGQAMPLLFASDGQINAVLPFGLPVNTPVQVVATNGAQVSVPAEITIAPAQPGVFALDGSGRGQGHIYVVNADGSSHLAGSASPAAAGDEVVIYCSGLGAVNPAVADGVSSPLSPVAYATVVPAVTIGGIPARVDFAGLTPGFAGLYQINANVPSGITPGDSVPLIVTSAGQSSLAAVTMAVK